MNSKPFFSDYDKHPDDYRFGFAIGFYGYSILCLLKNKLIPISHSNINLITALGLGSSYIYSSFLYYNREYEKSHRISFATSAITTGVIILNSAYNKHSFWYLASIIPGIISMKDYGLIQRSVKSQDIKLFLKEPNSVQKAHVAKESGKYFDMPDESIAEEVKSNSDNSKKDNL